MTVFHRPAAIGACLLALATAVGALAVPTRSDAQTPPGDRKVSWKGAAPSLTIAAPLAMIATGADKAQGITVDLQASRTSSTVTVDAVLAGQAMFGSPGTADALQAIRQGAKLKIVATIVNNLQVLVIRNDVQQRLGVPATAPIAERVRALKGLTLATGAVGSTHYQVVRTYLKQYGVDPDRDIRLVGLGDTSALIAGIEQKRFDAIAYASPIVEQAVARGNASIWISAPRGDVPGSEDVKMSVVVARADTIEKNKAEVDALLAALTTSMRAVRENHDETGEILFKKYFPNMDPKVWSAAWADAAGAYPSDLTFSRKAYEYWIGADAKGRDSYSNVDYAQVVYGPSQKD